MTKYTYDAAHRMLTITDPWGITFLTNEYDANGRVVKQTQADGGIWSFAYTTTGSFISQATVTDPRGNPTTSRFNSAGYLISKTDALGQTTTFTRQPGTNLLLGTTDPLGRVTRFTYDANGNTTSITDPAGNVRTFTYDPTFNKVTSLTDPVGNIRAFTYEATFNRVTSITDLLANVTRFSYDATGNLTAMTDPLTNTTTIAYNAFGQPTATTDPLGNTTTFSYNTQGDLVSIADPLGNTARREYDGVSRLVRQVDPRGKPTTFEYDPLNRLVTIVDALGGTTTFAYDPNGNLLTVADARGNTVTHEYDAMDRLSRRVDQLGRAETFAYDANGNLVSTNDRKGQTSTFTYDGLNRRTQSTFADGAVVTFQYDAGGRLTQADDTADPARPITRQYDALNQLLAETTAIGTVSYQYNPLGRRTQMTVSGQAPVTYTYDAASRLRTITQATLNPATLDYDPAGRRTLLTLPNGVSTEYQYDPASRLTALIYRNAVGPLGDLRYAYDRAGNRIAIGGSFARTLLPDPVSAATYDAANRQLAFGPNAMAYDENGNLATLNDGATTATLSWDARNRLTGWDSPASGTTFQYDALGRRGRKVAGAMPVMYQYDGPDAIRISTGGAELRYLRTVAVDEPLLQDDGSSPLHFLMDGLGSAIGFTDAQGRVVTSYAYDPFGRTGASGTLARNPFQFAGREHDETELYYYRARYYHPVLSRFIGEEPLGPLTDQLNAYAYVRNNPSSRIDSSGFLDTTPPGWKGPKPGEPPSATPPRAPFPVNPADNPPPVLKGMPVPPEQEGPHMPGTPGTRTEAAPSASRAMRGGSAALRALKALLDILKAFGIGGLQPILVPEDVIRCAVHPEQCGPGGLAALAGPFPSEAMVPEEPPPAEGPLGERK